VVSATVVDVAVLERRFGSPEAVLVARVAAGDDGALASLYDQFSSLVHGIAFRVTCDRGLAEEVVQDVFVCLWERPGSFDPDRGSVRTWLATLAHRRAVDRVRSSERARRREQASAAESRDVAAVDVAAEGEAADVSARLWAAVDALPEDQRAAVRLAYAEGRTYREVARILAIPEGTAKSRLRLGLRKLAGVLGEQEVAWS
jgi:RNA polymerase sigma factor (sigma-70 family)